MDHGVELMLILILDQLLSMIVDVLALFYCNHAL